MPHETAAVSYMRVCADWWTTGISCFCENVTIVVHVQSFGRQDDSDSKLVKTKHCHILSGSQAQGIWPVSVLWQHPQCFCFVCVRFQSWCLFIGLNPQGICFVCVRFSLGAYSPVWSDRAVGVGSEVPHLWRVYYQLIFSAVACLWQRNLIKLTSFICGGDCQYQLSCVCGRKSRPN